MARKNVKVNEFEQLLGSQAVTAEQIEEANRLEAHLRAQGELDDLDDLDTPDVEVLPSNEVLGRQRFEQRLAAAQKQLTAMRLSPMTKQLRQAAAENVATQRPAAWMDNGQKTETANRAALMQLVSFDVAKAVAYLVDALPVEDVPGQVYSLCFAVQKAANFVANLQYRQALRTDEDRRAEGVMVGLVPGQSFDDAHQDAPCGLGGGDEEPLDFGDSREHYDSQLRKDQEILAAFEELHLWLQLVAEAHDWDADEPMPYMYLANRGEDGELTGNFRRIDGAEHTLDVMEVRSAESRARRAKTRADGLGKALAAARAALMAA